MPDRSAYDRVHRLRNEGRGPVGDDMLGQPLDPTLMRTFEAVAEEGSFTRAGIRVGLTQQAVSAQMRRLETILGRPVFSRDDRGVSLTPDGEALRHYVMRAFRLAEQIGLHFSSVPLSDVVRFGAVEGFAFTGMPALMAAVQKRDPGIAVAVEIGNVPSLLTKLAAGQLDMVLGAQRPDRRVAAPLWSERLHWVGRTSMTRSAGTPVALAMRRSPSISRSVATDALTSAGMPYEIVFESDSLSALRTAIDAGFAIGALADSELRDEPVITDGLPELSDLEAFVRVGDASREGVSLFDKLLRDVAGGGDVAPAAALAPRRRVRGG